MIFVTVSGPKRISATIFFKEEKEMSVNAVTNNAYTAAYASNSQSAEKKDSVEAKKSTNEDAVVYEKSSQAAPKQATYSINKMSAQERASMVEKLKADQASRQQNFINIVRDMMTGQGKSFSLANGDDSMWKFLASGQFTVDPATKAQAQADIAEDGYWGVKQTSQRLFDFASALAGDDVEKMKEMQAAMEKGFKMATKTWGKELPSISQDTMAAANKLFEDYYASKQTVTE